MLRRNSRKIWIICRVIWPNKRQQYGPVRHAGIDMRYSQEDISRVWLWGSLPDFGGGGRGRGGIFDIFFGGGGHQGGPRRGSDIYELSINLEDAAFGKAVELEVQELNLRYMPWKRSKTGNIPKKCLRAMEAARWTGPRTRHLGDSWQPQHAVHVAEPGL